MNYLENYVSQNYDNLIKTDTAIKLLLSERYNLLELHQGFEKSKKEVVLLDVDQYIKDREYFDTKYETIRLHHISTDGIEKLNREGIKHSRTKLVHPIKRIDAQYFKFIGKRFKLDRYVTRKYDNMGFTVLNEPKRLEDVLDLLKFWDTNKRSTGTLMTFTGHDKSFFKRFYQNCKKKYDLLSYYFYDGDKLIGFTILEQVKPDFWILHTRKSDRFNYKELNFYLDIYAYRSIYNKTKTPFSIEIGYEMGKPTLYKEKRFPTECYVYVWNLTVDKGNTTKAKLRRLF